jgi:membrane-associated phospholipid phosphatase
MYGNEQGVDGRGMFLNGIKKNLEIYFFITLLLFLVSIVATSSNQPVFLFLNQVSVYTGESIWKYFTHLGDAAIIFGLASWLLVFKTELLKKFILGAIFTSLVVQGAKYGITVERPPGVLAPEVFILLQEKISFFSFPSGHSATIFLIACILYYQPNTPVWLCVALLTVASLVAFSRVAVGVHWPIDVLTGALVGWMMGVFSIYLNSKVSFARQTWLYWLAFLLFAYVLYLLVDNQSVFHEVTFLYWPVLVLNAIALLLFVYQQVKGFYKQGS